jgi:hypothetical protein
LNNTTAPSNGAASGKSSSPAAQRSRIPLKTQIGIGVGASVAVILMIIIALCIRRRKKAKAATENTFGYDEEKMAGDVSNAQAAPTREFNSYMQQEDEGSPYEAKKTRTLSPKKFGLNNNQAMDDDNATEATDAAPKQRFAAKNKKKTLQSYASSMYEDNDMETEFSQDVRQVNELYEAVDYYGKRKVSFNMDVKLNAFFIRSRRRR